MELNVYDLFIKGHNFIKSLGNHCKIPSPEKREKIWQKNWEYFGEEMRPKVDKRNDIKVYVLVWEKGLQGCRYN